MFVDRPTKLISGLVFGGEFLSSSYDSMADNICIEVGNTNKQLVKDLEQMIVEKNLDTESIKNLDTLEKVFETIEEI